MKFTTEKDKYVIFTLAIVLVSLTGLLSKDVSGLSDFGKLGAVSIGLTLFFAGTTLHQYLKNGI
ncbi:MAG: hypothetical protein ACI837_002213 [Crocinitomicaceae bacterium]|jgi:hypothetical protein